MIVFINPDSVTRLLTSKNYVDLDIRCFVLARLFKLTIVGYDRLWRLGLVRGQISPFPIDFADRPYNTLTLPCESVITECKYLGYLLRKLSYS